ncbi:MAG: hypothetical protein AAB574_00990 [Patescibacteria group bacterium]
MAKNYDKAAVVIAQGPKGWLETFNLHYGSELTGIGVRADLTTNRVTFDRRINKVTVVDAGGIEIVRRKLPFIGQPIKVGVPPATPEPESAIRILFEDVIGQKAAILGLKVET